MQDDDSLWTDVSPDAARRLLLAALDSFASIGYHATTTRDIAARAAMSPAAVYVHFASKEELLQTISRIGHESALQAFNVALAAGTSPGERIRNAVRAFTAWHIEHQTLARVVQYELGSLQNEGRREIRALRASFEQKLRNEIEAGAATGEFSVDDIPGVATAIFSLCIDVARWFSPRGKRDPSAIADLYAELCIRMISS